MAKYEWLVDFIGIPTQDPDWGPGFLQDAGLTAVKLSPDVERLREAFVFEDVPYGAMLEDGTVLERLVFWEEPALSEALREHAFIE